MKRSVLLAVFLLPSLALADAPRSSQSGTLAGDNGSPGITDDQRELIGQLTPDISENLPADAKPFCRTLLHSFADGTLEYLEPSVIRVTKEDESLRKKLEPCSVSMIGNPYRFRSDGPMRYTVYEPRRNDVVGGVSSPLFIKEEGYLYIVFPEQFHKDPIAVGTVWYYLVDRNSCRHWETEISGGNEYPPGSLDRSNQTVSHLHGLIRYDGKIMLFELSPEFLGPGGPIRGANFLNVFRPSTIPPLKALGPTTAQLPKRYGWAGQCGFAAGGRHAGAEWASPNKPLEPTR